jgi:hypothetical protein
MVITHPLHTRHHALPLLLLLLLQHSRQELGPVGIASVQALLEGAVHVSHLLK